MYNGSLRLLQIIAGVGAELGGASAYVVALHTALGRAGCEATLLSPDYGTTGNGILPTMEREELSESLQGLIITPKSRPYFLKNSWSLVTSIIEQTRSADFVEIHGQYLLPNIYGYLAARILRVPFSVHPHGTLEPYQLAQSSKRKKFYDKLIGEKILRDASLIVVTSNSELERAAGRVDRRKLAVVTPGVQLETPSTAPSFVESLGDIPRSRRALFLGRLTAKKNLECLLRGWASRPSSEPCQLVIAGPDHDVSASDLLQLAEVLDISDSVKIVGGVYGGDKTWLYDHSSVFVLPSDNENFGIAVAEAASRGCHLVATIEVAALETVSTGDSVSIIESVNPLAIASAIDQAFHSSEVASQEAVELFNWDASAESLVSLYCNVLNSPGSAANR